MENPLNYDKIPEWAKPSTNDIVEEIRWWEAQNIPWQLVRELRRRKNSVNIGFNASDKTTLNFANEHDKYRGSMTPWVRVFSNGTGRVTIPYMSPSYFLYKNGSMPIYDGFVLEGGKDFYKGYGYTQTGTSVKLDNAIIGYQADGSPHYIDKAYRSDTSYNVAIQCSEGVKFPQNASLPSVLPPPGIVSVNVKTNKDMMSTGTINWKCYGLAQLEYMMPFFLTPKINIFLEFGWNLFDIQSLVNLKDRKECYELIKKPETAIERYYRSLGNYGLITGIIWKYNFDTPDGFVYNCKTEIYSRQALWAGWRPDSYVSSKDGNSGQPTTKEYLNLKEFLRNYLQFTKQIITAKEGERNFIAWIKNYVDPTRSKKSSENEKDKKSIKDKVLSYATDKALETVGIPNPTTNVPNELKTLKTKSKLGPDNIRENLKTPFKPSKIFYEGRGEDRIFMGRYNGVYEGFKRYEIESAPTPAGVGQTGGGNFLLQAQQASKALDSKKIKSPIGYGSIDTPQGTPNIVSYADKIDFDNEESGDKEAWYQLDFVFELINLFCTNKNNKNNYIDISDVIVNAHPNLISCDKNVLIPNPIAPKINYGLPQPTGYLAAEEWSPGADEKYRNLPLSEQLGAVTSEFFATTTFGIFGKKDVFNEDVLYNSVNQFANKNRRFYWKNFDEEIKQGLNIERGLLKKKIEHPDCIVSNIDQKSIWKAAFRAKNVFKTDGAIRDNLDVIINKLHYERSKKPESSAAFPFNKVYKKIIKNDNTSEWTIDNEKSKQYEPYYNGFLKNIYISKTVLNEIGEDESLKTLEQIVQKILNTINEAVGDFWKLDVILNSNGGIKIVDKNATLPKKSAIYMFDAGSTSNVIKNINFNVTLTNEQTNQVLYGSGNNSETYAERLSNITSNDKLKSTEKINKITQLGNSIPSIVFEDRLDTEAMRERTENAKLEIQDKEDNGSVDDIPTGPIETQNVEISSLQKYGPQSDVLIMTVRALYTGDDPSKSPIELPRLNTLNWVYLNLPPTLKPKLQQMLDDGDTIYNNAKYSGPADNFTLSITFDGIMGFRMFQYIAISNLPKPYVPGNVVFMITEVEHQINSGKWETVVTAMLTAAPDKGYKYIPI